MIFPSLPSYPLLHLISPNTPRYAIPYSVHGFSFSTSKNTTPDPCPCPVRSLSLSLSSSDTADRGRLGSSILPLSRRKSSARLMSLGSGPALVGGGDTDTCVADVLRDAAQPLRFSLAHEPHDERYALARVGAAGASGVGDLPASG